ncbi:MAG: small-conductance mechanosensitive ion channel [Chloroflexi bacterium]|nr:small-conductance mechanosensitive ion channel [Chloroflexota bacterium]
MVSLTGALALFLGAIPKVVGFLVILLIGWLVASVLAGIVARVLRAVNFNALAGRSGFDGFIQNMGVQADSAGFVAGVTKWFVRLIVLVVAFDALGLPAVSQVLQQLLLWLPNLVVALMVLVLGGLAANALAGIVRGATAQAGLGRPDVLANVARVAVWGFAIIVAVNQIGIASNVVNILITGLVGALALALGLAFGLGGRETAAEIVRAWYQNIQQAAPRIAHATDASQGQPQSSSEERRTV